MTGPEHYKEAEQLVATAEDAHPDADVALVSVMLQFAQVHATLALAAACARPAYLVTGDTGPATAATR